MSTTGEQTKHYCNRYGNFCTGANDGGECTTTACWNDLVRWEAHIRELETTTLKEPSIKVEIVKHAKWVKVYGDHMNMGHRVWALACSECGLLGDGTPYCPNCGARMEE